MRKKGLIGGAEDSLQLFPLRYQWAWDMYLGCMANHWSPQEVPMGRDVQLWKGNTLLEDERHLFLSVMAQLTTFDVLRGDDAAETFLKMFTAPEVKHFLKRLIDEEANHTFAYQTVVENLGLDPEDIYTRYRNVPEMANRVALAGAIAASLEDVLLDQGLRQRAGEDPIVWTTEEKQTLLYALVFWLLFEGVWFVLDLSGPLQNLARGGKFMATAEQFQLILRDEQEHVRFWTLLTKQFMLENPECLTDEFKNRVVSLTHKVVELEDAFIDYCIPVGIVGYPVPDHKETTRFYANLRLSAVGLEPVFPGAKHQFVWMHEMLQSNKEKSFFETRVTDYQVGGALKWD